MRYSKIDKINDYVYLYLSYKKEYKIFNEDDVRYILYLLNDNNVKNFYMSGAEPFNPKNQKIILELLKEIRKNYPNINICVKTSLDLKDLDGMTEKLKYFTENTSEILSFIDILYTKNKTILNP